MRFNCPECATPHEFDDTQIPAEGIVVACTRCTAHITLNKQGVISAQPLEPEPAPAPAPSPFGGGLAATSAAQGAIKPSPRTPAPEPMFEPATEQAIDDIVPDISPEDVLPDNPLPKAGKGRFGNAMSSFANAAKDVADVAGQAIEDAAGERMSGEMNVPEGLQFPGFEPGDGVWCWKDLPRAFMGVMDVRRVGFAIAGFWVSLVAFGLVQWLAAFLGAKVWGPLGSILDIAAWVVLVGGAAIVASVMGYVVHLTVIEQRATTIKEGIAWTKKWGKSVVGTPLAFAGVILAAGVAEGVIGLLGRIPWAGPIVWGALSPLIWLLSIAAGLVGVALIYCLPLYIPVIYNEGTGPVQTLKRLLSLFRSHGSQLLGYVLLSGITIGFAFWVTLMPALAGASYLTMRVGDAAMGPNFMQTMSAVPPAFGGILSKFAMVFGGGGGENFGHTLGGWFAGIGGLIPQAVVLAVIGLTYYTAGAIIYSIVTGRKKA
jgi:predicted Zn finger-like uncharacterized protein